MKTAISIPDKVYRSAEALAARLGVSRSELYARALAALVEKHRESLITERLNQIYAPEGESGALDREAALLQHRTLARSKR